MLKKEIEQYIDAILAKLQQLDERLAIIQKDIKQLEKEIIKSLKVNINVNWDAGENNPSEEFEMLIDHVKRLFKKYA